MTPYLLIGFQAALIGLSAWSLSTGLSAGLYVTHVAVIAVNVAFMCVSVVTITRQ